MRRFSCKQNQSDSQPYRQQSNILLYFVSNVCAISSFHKVLLLSLTSDGLKEHFFPTTVNLVHIIEFKSESSFALNAMPLKSLNIIKSQLSFSIWLPSFFLQHLIRMISIFVCRSSVLRGTLTCSSVDYEQNIVSKKGNWFSLCLLNDVPDRKNKTKTKKIGLSIIAFHLVVY